MEFEERFALFDLNEEGLGIWDIIRFPVYLDYMWENFKDQQPKEKNLIKFKQLFTRFRLLVLFLFKRSRPNIFFTFSRDKTEEGLFYDKNANDFLRRLYRESHIIETYQVRTDRYMFPVSLIKPASLFNRIYYFFYRERDYGPLLDTINSSLHLHWNNKMINRCMSYFKSERLVYSLILRLKRPKTIYVTQNGIQKALFSAARRYNVTTIEFQHGIIDRGHIAYHYPSTVNSSSRIYVPDMLLTFSPFWGHDIHYPVKKIIPAGNTAFANATRKKTIPAGNAIAFISADVFGLKLADLAKEYAAKNPADTILFKLHPNEFTWKKEFEQSFREFPNISIVTNEYPTDKILLSCKAVVLIQSTLAYEALQAGIRVFIYKEMTYYRHSHIFGSPNVKLIDKAAQIIVNDTPPTAPSEIYFDTFDEKVYHLLSNSQ